MWARGAVFLLSRSRRWRAAGEHSVYIDVGGLSPSDTGSSDEGGMLLADGCSRQGNGSVTRAGRGVSAATDSCASPQPALTPRQLQRAARAPRLCVPWWVRDLYTKHSNFARRPLSQLCCAPLAFFLSFKKNVFLTLTSSAQSPGRSSAWVPLVLLGHLGFTVGMQRVWLDLKWWCSDTLACAHTHIHTRACAQCSSVRAQWTQCTLTCFSSLFTRFSPLSLIITEYICTVKVGQQCTVAPRVLSHCWHTNTDPHTRSLLFIFCLHRFLPVGQLDGTFRISIYLHISVHVVEM